MGGGIVFRRRTALALVVGLMALMLAGGPAIGQTETCQDHRAWPSGPHLSEKIPSIVSLFFAVHGEGACEQWAEEHRQSAVKGLRALGYSVEQPFVPVVDVDGRTFRGSGDAWGEVTLETGCYVAWLNYADRTVQWRIEAARNRPWVSIPFETRPRIRLEFSQPDDELVGWNGIRYGNETYITGNNDLGDVIEVNEHGRLRLGYLAPRAAMTPGKWRWRVAVPRRAETENWELQFVPTPWTIEPWSRHWEFDEWAPPCLATSAS